MISSVSMIWMSLSSLEKVVLNNVGVTEELIFCCRIFYQKNFRLTNSKRSRLPCNQTEIAHKVSVKTLWVDSSGVWDRRRMKGSGRNCGRVLGETVLGSWTFAWIYSLRRNRDLRPELAADQMLVWCYQRVASPRQLKIIVNLESVKSYLNMHPWKHLQRAKYSVQEKTFEVFE